MINAGDDISIQDYIKANKMKFVYSLIDENGNVFYIGCTKDLRTRYRQHISQSYLDAPVNVRIKQILETGVFPEIRIIDYLPQDMAEKREGEIIYMLTKMGHNLVNVIHSRLENDNIPLSSVSTIQDIMKIIKYRMEDFVFWNKPVDNDGNKINFPYAVRPTLKSKKTKV